MSSYTLAVALLLCWCLQVNHSEDPNNQPGARQGALGLYDISLREVFWLFGGEGLGSASRGLFEQPLQQTIHQKYSFVNVIIGYLNDLWKY